MTLGIEKQVFLLLTFGFFFLPLSCEVLRWADCAAATNTLSGTTFSTTETDLPQKCFDDCTSRLATLFGSFAHPAKFAILTPKPAAFQCQCPWAAASGADVSLPNEGSINAATFGDCDVLCSPDNYLERCGSSSTSKGTWYANATMSSASAIMYDMCYTETSAADLESCRTLRTLMAIVMTRAKGDPLMFTDLVFVDPCDESSSATSVDCSPLATCNFDDVTGYRTCECDPGYRANTTGGLVHGLDCVDIDECTNGTHDCDLTKSTCENTVGSFVCNCNVGYTKQSGECEQVYNECLMDVEPICDPKADCETNLPLTGHTCTCTVGYTGNGEVGGCTDIDECTNPAACNLNQNCTNTIGSFTCPCDVGFINIGGSGTGICFAPAGEMECDYSSRDPISSQRRVIYSSNCDITVLLDCNDTDIGFPRQRIETATTLRYAMCDNNVFVSTFDSSILVPNAFETDGGKGLLYPTTECSKDYFMIKFSKDPVYEAGFDLSNLFLGGDGDFSVVEPLYGSDSDCRGQVWYENGFQYLFQVDPSVDDCGVDHSIEDGNITYTGTIRGQLGEVFGVISRIREFRVSFKCTYEENATTSSTDTFFVYNLSRRKRDLEETTQLDVLGNSLSLIMGLYQDKDFTQLYLPSNEIAVGKEVFVKIDLENENGAYSFIPRVLECRQTLANQQNKFKIIIKKGCDPREWATEGVTLLPQALGSSFGFGFQAQSIEGGVEDFNVVCFIDVGSSTEDEFNERCEAVFSGGSSFQVDGLTVLQTVGTIRVKDVCGGRSKGGCEHYCSVTEENTPLCYCAKNFVVDTDHKSGCIVPENEHPPSSSSGPVYWYYIVLPIVLIIFIILVAWAVVRWKNRSSFTGMYKFNPPDDTD